MQELILKCHLTGKCVVSKKSLPWQRQERSVRMKRWHREKREQQAAAMNAIADQHRFLSGSPLGLSSIYNFQKSVKPICSKDSSNLSNSTNNSTLSNKGENNSGYPGGSQGHIDSKDIENSSIDNLGLNNNSLNNNSLNNKALNNSNSDNLTNNDLTLNSNSINNQNYNLLNIKDLDINYRAPRRYNNDGTTTTFYNSMPEKVKRRPKGLSIKNKDMIQGCNIILERKYGNHKLTFLTCTIPDMDKEDEINVAANWNQIIDDYVQSLRYYFKQLGIELEIILVTEIHPKALERGRLKYHIHAVFRNKINSGDDWIITPKLSDKLWQAAVDKHTSKSYPIKANRLERVKKSAAAYMSKYMSKGSDNYDKLVEIKKDHLLPHSWYYGSQLLKREVKQWIKDHTYEINYKGGLAQLRKDLKAPHRRKQVEGLNNREPDPFYAPWDEELLLALIIYFNPKYADNIGINLIGAMLQWEQEREEDYYVRAG